MRLKKILFLGYTSKKTKLISILKKKYKVKEFGQKKLNKKAANSYDIIISFGYRKIISEKILASLYRPPINLHMSYLPFNRGAHPNYWSFVEGGPIGISIHEINKKIDGGKIIIRKKIKIKLDKKLTFKKSYEILKKEIENLFLKNYNSILKRNYNLKKYKSKGSFHLKKDLPENLKSWNEKILNYLHKLN